MQWQPIIGLEVHVQLNTDSKIFAQSATEYGAEANMQACDVSIALPGTLPVMNREAARLAVKFGLATNSTINSRSIFARKHYFYPDLPKGYQISQYEQPIVGKGSLEILTSDGLKTITITRAHLEEDAGKSLHEEFHELSGIDLNRAGIPLLEIVSEPEMHSSAEAVSYLRKVHTLVRYLKISDGNMQEGSFRCDANVSVKPFDQQALGTRVEIKNLNSFRFLEKSIEYELERQIEILEDGGKLVQETRLYDADKNETRSMRSKEDSHDYRYFPDPDLPPLIFDQEFIEAVRAELPELPDTRKARFEKEFGLPLVVAEQLTGEIELADYFEEANAYTNASPKIVANWILGEWIGAIKRHDLPINQSPISGQQLAQLLDRIADNTISGKIAKEVFQAMWQGQGTADIIIASKGLQQITASQELEAIAERIVATYPEQVRQYRDGKPKLLGFFVGKLMKETGGKANPVQANQILSHKLDQ